MNNNQVRPQSPLERSPSTSPSRRGAVPLSYAYGAPTLGKTSPIQTSPSRAPSPTRSTSSSVRNRSARSILNNPIEVDEDIDSNFSYASSSGRGHEPGAVRYARLKQRNQALGTATYHPSGPGIILSPPNGANLRDTSVNVATAFSQAVQHAMPPGHPHDYDKETHTSHTSATTTNRRIAPPPPKSRKPNSQTSSRLEPPDEIVNRNGRAKSPIFETMASASQAIARAVSPTRYFLRENDQGEEAPFQPLRMEDLSSAKPLSRQGTKASTQPSNDSYDYEAEESYMRGEGSTSGGGSRPAGHQKRKSAAMSTSARLSMDNKAYKPPSDDEEEEDFEVDGVRRKRKGKKKEEGKALTTLPTIGYDKKKKKKSINKRSGVPVDEEDGVSGGEQVHPPAEDRRSTSHPPDRPSSRPPSRAGSVSRDSVPPSHPAHFQPSLDEVLETDDLSDQDADASRDSDIQPRLRAQSRDRPPASLRPQDNGRSTRTSSHSDTDIRQMEAQTLGHDSPPFSLGRILGKVVHFVLRKIIQSMAMLVFLVWTVIAGIFTVLVSTPLRWIEATTRSARHDLPWSNIGKVMFFAFAVAVGAAALRPSTIAGSSFGDALLRWIPYHGGFTYRAPDIPAESVQDLIARLTHVESALADLALKEQQAQKAHSVEQRVHGEVASRVELLHGRIEAEAQRALEAEEQFRAAAAKGLTAIRNEFATLQSEWDRLHGEGATGIAALDDLRELQERVGTVEGGVKEALELGKASKASGNVGWWNKWNGAGEGRLTIKSSDGQDVTGLIGSLVDHAISRFSKDTLGKPDFALYSAGGRVIPQLTTSTYEVKPNTWARYVVGAVTGSGYTMGRPPVTAIHPDINVGNCWPFAGTHGQIGLLLARSVFISEFTIDHAPRDIAYDVRSAPRQMEVWGLVQGKDNVAKVREYQQSVRARRAEAVRRAEELGVPPLPEDDSYPPSLPRSPHYIRLAQFSYDIHSPEHIQTFSVPLDIQEIGADFGVVVLLIKNNWGEEDFTCLYRLRVHGTDKDRRPYLLPEHDAP
ncbi:hypothetical protein JB92DRAFT_3139415 [Gautieria morchelliformis]|nr:hypothetical protein JB92DRAFT_3139415 [Gautieria morchelliformis]